MKQAKIIKALIRHMVETREDLSNMEIKWRVEELLDTCIDTRAVAGARRSYHYRRGKQPQIVQLRKV